MERMQMSCVPREAPRGVVGGGAQIDHAGDAMTLPNTRAAGLRQAAEYLREESRSLELEAAQTGHEIRRKNLLAANAAYWAAFVHIDRMAKEAEDDDDC